MVRVFLRVELARPWGLGQLVEAATTPDLAREVYLASIMAIEVDSDAERNYLTRLAERLGLDAAATGEIKALLEPDDEAPHS